MNLDTLYCYSYRGYSFACGLSPRRVGITGCHLCHNGRTPVIQNLSLRIPAGKTIAIVGSTGSGKSTLVKLLLRLYEVQAEPSGSMALICVIEAEGFALLHWLGQSGCIFISWHCGGEYCLREFSAAPSEVIAAKIAEAHDFVITPKAMRRLWRARSEIVWWATAADCDRTRRFEEPPILILDEATSAVDNETEAAIQIARTNYY